jgi:glycosyltransferase involved in cell wall biosynthesis
MEKVTAIIPTFNRFKYLMNTIKSMKEQTYDNMEIIVVNDCSTEKEYYEYNWEENGIIIIHLEENSKKKFGFACAGYVRNKGIEKSTGKYLAFCDDDDVWFVAFLFSSVQHCQRRQQQGREECDCVFHDYISLMAFNQAGGR